jgi:1-acyl-sn-glycerol-3-phosphate acyltransferase
VIRQGENVGLFPEAVRNWSGETQPMDKSIAKLIKLLNAPVIIAVLRGMNLFNPRWSPKLRKARVEVEYKLLLRGEEISNLTEEEIFEKLSKGIYHNEVDYQRDKKIKINSDGKAEFINHALYICPNCKAIDSFKAKGNCFHCEECNYDICINDFGFFDRKSGGQLYFDNIRDWFNWQETHFYNLIGENILLVIQVDYCMIRIPKFIIAKKMEVMSLLVWRMYHYL